MYVAKHGGHNLVIVIEVVVTEGHMITTRKPDGNPASHQSPTSDARAYLEPNNRRMLKTIGGEGPPSVCVSVCEGESNQ